MYILYIFEIGKFEILLYRKEFFIELFLGFRRKEWIFFMDFFY